MSISDEKRFDDTINEMDFAIATSCISLFRYITDAISSLPLSVLTQVLTVKDMVCVLVHLLEKGPWIRKNGDRLERFEAGIWHSISEDDLSLVGKIEGQVI